MAALRYALTMGTKTAISVDEYLHTSFPGVDSEYRDGELVERTMPVYSHGRTQLQLGIFFGTLPKQLSVYPSVETRVNCAKTFT
jgi:Uma2 family endonuclease